MTNLYISPPIFDGEESDFLISLISSIIVWSQNRVQNSSKHRFSPLLPPAEPKVDVLVKNEGHF